MRNLIHFIFKNAHWLLFGLLIYLSVFLIVKNSHFQRSKYLRAVQEVTGSIYSVTNRFYSYLNLNSANADLLSRIAQLETEVYSYQNQIADLTNDAKNYHASLIDSATYHVFPAQVVKNSISLRENYLTLNKGSNDGIEPGMGVLSANGIVGVVDNTSAHFSLVVSLLNTKYKPSGRIKRNEYNHFGLLAWDGKDAHYVHLTEIPRHIDFEYGDTVVTSGYSTVFPKGIPVGYIVDTQKKQDDNLSSIRIRLFTDFSRLNNVLIVANRFQKEQQELEERSLNLKPR